tara:strand:+ start:3786 stop:3902 length:117 start_codon:yes stop_codon:yes gene_type:complete
MIEIIIGQPIKEWSIKNLEGIALIKRLGNICGKNLYNK